MDDRHRSYMMKLGRKLLQFASEHDIRQDWHECENQGISGEVIGTIFDNSGGSKVYPNLVKDGSQEFVLRLSKGNRQVDINLADLVALASEGAMRLFHEREPAESTLKGNPWDFPAWKIDGLGSVFGE